MIYLVACCKQKAATRQPAQDLYVSDWFRKARAFVESTGEPWLILSAEHGLLDPATIIDPYDHKLTPAANLVWARRVAIEIRKRYAPQSVGLLAGAKYRQHLEGELAMRGFTPLAPLSNMGIVKQKRWLAEATPAGVANNVSLILEHGGKP